MGKELYLPSQTLSRVNATYATLDTDERSFGSGVVFAFTERTGGVSKAPYDSLNLGAHVGDDPKAVRENRMRVLIDLDAPELIDKILVPNQVHGTDIVVVSDKTAPLAHERLAQGADAVVCTAKDVPVMLCYADCVPVVLVAPGGFAVVHSGWKGTIGHISVLAARSLAAACGCGPDEINAYIGPHIDGGHYEVSLELLADFIFEFDPSVNPCGSNLDLARAIELDLEREGLARERIVNARLSTVGEPRRFFSYRASGGVTGRHAAIAILRPGRRHPFHAC